jgi:hypothetical protein
VPGRGGAAAQDFTPRIFLAESDFLSLTENQKLLRPGRVNEAEFEVLIRDQMKLYTQTRLSSMSEAWSGSEADFTTLGALKHILLAQISARADQDLLHAKVERLLAKAESSSASAAGDACAGQGGAGDRRGHGGKQGGKAATRRLSLCRTVLEGSEEVRAGSLTRISASFSEGVRGRNNGTARGAVGRAVGEERAGEAAAGVGKRRSMDKDKGPSGLGLDCVASTQLPLVPDHARSGRRSPKRSASPKRAASPKRSADRDEVKRAGKGRKAQAGGVDFLATHGQKGPASFTCDLPPPLSDASSSDRLNPSTADAESAEPAADKRSLPSPGAGVAPEDEAVATAEQPDAAALPTAHDGDRPSPPVPLADSGLALRTEGSRQERSSRARLAVRVDEDAGPVVVAARDETLQGRTGRLSNGRGQVRASVSSALVMPDERPAN